MRYLISAYWKRRIQTDEVRRASIIDEQRQAEKKRQKEQEEANHREIIASLKKIADSHDTYTSDRRTEDSYRRTWEGKRFRLDVAGVIVAAAAAAFLLWQQHTMQGQLDEMQAEKRAWISFNMQIEKPPLYSHFNETFYFKYILKNTGQSPAINVEFVPWYDFSAPGDKSAYTKWIMLEKTKCSSIRVEHREERGIAIFPGDFHSNPYTPSVHVGLNSDNTYRMGTASTFQFVVYGCVNYRTVDNEIHQTPHVSTLLTSARAALERGRHILWWQGDLCIDFG